MKRFAWLFRLPPFAFALVVLLVAAPLLALAQGIVDRAPVVTLAPAPTIPPAVSPLLTLVIQNLWIVVMLAALYIIAPLIEKLATYLGEKAKTAAPGSIAQRALSIAAVLAHCAAHGVIQVESELRPTIKDVGADGKISPEEGEHLKQEAIARAVDYAKTCFPDVIAAAGFSDEVHLGEVLAHHVETQAAIIAGNSRANIDRHDDTAPAPAVPPSPAVA